MVRKLCFIEQLTWRIALQTPTNFSIITEMDGGFSKLSLRNALEKIIGKYPLLSAKIICDAEGVAYFSTKGVGRLIIKEKYVNNDNDWVDIVQIELAEPFNWEVGPLVRFTIIRSEKNFYLITVCHHCLADALAVINIINDLLKHIANPGLIEPQGETIQAMDKYIPLRAKKGLSFHMKSSFTNLQIKILKSWNIISKIIFTGTSQQTDKNIKKSPYIERHIFDMQG